MNKEELKKIMVSELKQTWTHPAEVVADRILARMPDEIVIAEALIGETISINYQNGNKAYFGTGNYKDKKIRLKIEVLNES